MIYRIDREKQQIRISFKFNEMLKDLVKTISGRQFDWAQKQWVVPLSQLEVVAALLEPYGFVGVGLTDEERQRIERNKNAQGKGEKDEDDLSIVTAKKSAFNSSAAFTHTSFREVDSSQNAVATHGVISSAAGRSADRAIGIMALQNLIAVTISGHFRQPLWIVCEISDIRKLSSSHCYFQAIEKDERTAKLYKISAVIWQSVLAKIEGRIDGHFSLQNGIEVRLLVNVSYYQQRGSMSLHVVDIDPSFTLGKFELHRREILETLRKEQLIERNRHLPMPILPLRIALISSPQASGRKDFLHHLAQSGISFHVDCYPVMVQGTQVESDVCVALKRIIKRHYDVVIITRGGGSRADLAWFDNLKIARLVATLPIKVIVGIGHETDRGVLDEIAHSVKTPTAAADTLIDIVSVAYGQLDQMRMDLQDLYAVQLKRQRTRLQSQGYQFVSQTRRRLQQQKHVWHIRASDVLHRVERRLAKRLMSYQQASQRLSDICIRQLARHRRVIDDRGACLRRRSQRRIAFASTQMQKVGWQVASYDPATIFARGFVQIKDKSGHIIRSIGEVSVGDSLTARLLDGTLNVLVDGLQPIDTANKNTEEGDKDS